MSSIFAGIMIPFIGTTAGGSLCVLSEKRSEAQCQKAFWDFA